MTQITLLPRPDDLPDFDAAVAQLEDVPRILYEASEHAAYKTNRFKRKSSPKAQLDAGLAAGLFRFFAMRYLKAHGIEARAEGSKWALNKLPFLGISFYYNGYHVRVLKGPHGALPGCGVSKRRKRFYRQMSTNYLLGSVPMRSTANLVVLWDLTSSYHLSGLSLALPAEGGTRQQDVSAYWITSLEHPAFRLSELNDDKDGGLGNLIGRSESEKEAEENDRGASSAS